MFNISEKVKEASNEAMKKCKEYFEYVEDVTEYNQSKVLKAFIDAKVSESHFNTSTGYGYSDRGREVLDEVYANIFKAEDAMVRHNFVSGTHALTVALFGILRPNDTFLSVTGMPYDTLRNVIGIGHRHGEGSLKDFGINYKQVDMKEDGTLDFEQIRNSISNDLKMVYIQRSRGYTLRNSLSVEDIKKIVAISREKAPNAIIMVDNCYGEFVEKSEPIEHGVDIAVGSLIKNPGGGIALNGGYIVGRKDLVELCSYRLTTPGTGKDLGATLNQNRNLFLGTFNAPHVTGEALKTAIFASALFEELGYEVLPRYNQKRSDIVQVLKLLNEDRLISFCKGIQMGSPVDSFVSPEPWDMPGYDNKVIMAAGTFTLGSSIELSADAPLREPYAVWMQGGINFHSGKLGVMIAASNM